MRNPRLLARALRVGAVVVLVIALQQGWHGTTSDENGFYPGSNLHLASRLLMLSVVLFIAAYVVSVRARRATRGR
jgi:hypothetical protein